MTARRLGVVIAVLLLIIAIRTLFVGYDSYTPLVFAQLYVGLFAILMMFPTLVRTGESAGGDRPILLVVSAAAGAVLFALAAPRIGEPNYCGTRDLLYTVVRVPTVYRCTTRPFAAAGWFAGWWFVLWAADWWTTRLGIDSSDEERETAKTSLSVGAVMALAVTLMIVASLSLFAGSRSFKPLVFAEIYIWLFTIFAAIATRLQTEQINPNPDWYLLFASALAGAVLFWNLAPQIGEPNYCVPLPRGLRVLQDLAREISRSVGVTPPPVFRPRIFRCTSLPFSVVGGFGGWWVAFWATQRRKPGQTLINTD